MTLLTLLNPNLSPPASAPDIAMKALLTFAGSTDDGRLIEAVAIPWFEILAALRKNPEEAYAIPPRQWEEIIAGAYAQAGFDEVILTPRSGDFGRDVVATKHGVGAIRIFDQVKAYRPGHLVTADEVRSMLGVVAGAANVSKGVMTGLSGFLCVRRDETCPRRRASLATNDRRGGQVGVAFYAAVLMNRSP